MIPLKDNIPSRRIPIMNYLLIAVNTAIFILELKIASYGLLENFIFNYGLVSKRFFSIFPNDWYTLFSAMFLHGGWMHFLGNMLYLYIFGDNVEDRLGHFIYVIFYIFCGVVAAILQIVFSFNSNLPMIGASGAIGGVLGAYFLLYPNARILTLVFFGFFSRIVAVPAFFFLGFWFIIQLM
ncbi:MAG: rhomboid family intramembrane serine protease, partial [Endomicrobiia bacterium]